MIKIISYIIPIMMNFVFGAILFISVQRFTNAGASSLLTGLPLTAWALIYGGLNPIIGKCANEKNAAKLIICSGFLTFLSAAGLLFVPNIYFQILWMALLGVAFAIYCVPFQVFAKSIESGGSSGGLAAVGKTAGRYTASWSMGIACGPLVFGFLNPRIGFSICMGIGLLISLMLWIVSRYLQKQGPAAITADVTTAEETAPAHPKIDFAWVGWIVGGIGTFSICQLRTQLQPLGTTCGFSEQALAIMLFSISFVQSMTGLALSFTGIKWQFKRLPALLIGLIGIGTLFLIGFRDLSNFYYAATAVYGIYSGCFYYYFVYYSLSHPTKSGVYTGVNELVVSLINIFAPILGGVLATMNQTYPFRIAGTLIIFATIFHQIMLARAAKRLSAE